MTRTPLRILIIGAHPDDAEYKSGGTAALWADAGHTVRFVSATNGDAGHFSQGGQVLADRRLAEARAAAAMLGAQSEILDIHDGLLEPNLDNRLAFIRLIRGFAPDLIVTHRPNDYHPDHRYTSLLVQDSAFMVTVPNVAPDVPPLRQNPIIMYCWDGFRKPVPFAPAVVVDVDSVVRRKYDALAAHVSQFFEWLPWNQRVSDQVPADEAARRQWLFETRTKMESGIAEQFREMLIARYGRPRGEAARYAEAFEACEYGAPLTAERLERLFGGI